MARTRQADRSTTSLEVLFPSAFAGRAALSEAASLRTIPLRRCACRVPDSAGVGLSGAGVVPAVFPPCVYRAHGPRRAIVVTVHTGPIRVIRHGLSFARRSATRWIEPFHDRAGPAANHFAFSPATLMGLLAPFAVFLSPRFPAFLRFVPTCRFPNRSRASPLIFTGCRSPLCKTPSEERVPKWDRRREQSDRLLGHAAANKLSRARSTIERATGQSCHGLFWGLLSGVSDAFSQHAFFAPLVVELVLNAANRRSRAFRWLPSAHGFCGDCCRRCTRALGFF